MISEQIVITSDAFDSDFCDRCLQLTASERGAAGPDQDTEQVRRSNIAWAGGVILNKDIIFPIVEFFHAVNQDVYNFDLVDIEAPQFTEYLSEESGKYDPHQDCFTLQNGLVRKLSMVIQLSEPDSYSGGDLVFPDHANYSSELTKAKGTAIVFPSHLIHGITPLTSGVRHSMVCWANGPTFR